MESSLTDGLLIDPYPDEIQARLEARERFLPPSINGMGLEFVIDILSRWNPGQTLRVAFLDGPPELHAQIAEAATKWTEHGNIGLDFGPDQQTGRFRSWSESDTGTYTAEIRIAFYSAPDLRRGYWSMVGTDSVDSTIVGPGVASMNFGGFLGGMPADGQATVIHEFGHALGFHHEHQHPLEGCEREFRWDDDPGYVPTRNVNGGFIADASGRRPGLYTVLGSPPNGWPTAKVDFNLRQLRNASAFMTGSFDVRSIMKYAFPEWMFQDGNQSPCFSPRNVELSQLDKVGIASAYPASPQAMADVTAQRRTVLEAVEKDASVPLETKQRAGEQLEGLNG